MGTLTVGSTLFEFLKVDLIRVHDKNELLVIRFVSSQDFGEIGENIKFDSVFL